jgi:PucR family transcriptional regulator, purine catabolism regulatory protein
MGADLRDATRRTTGPARGAYTVGDLLAESELGLELMAGPREGLDRPVVGAHAVEGVDPSRYLVRDWVMLTDGLNLPEGADRRTLVAELDEGGVAALGFGVHAAHDAFAAGLIAAADSVGFPVFSVPAGTEFRDVVARVHANAASEEYRAYGRLPALLQYLLDGLQQEHPKHVLVARLAEFLNSSVAIVDQHRRVQISSDRLDWDALLHEVRVDGPGGPLQTETHVGVVRPIGTPDKTRGALVIVNPLARGLHPLTRSAAKAAVPLLTTIGDMERAAQTHTEAARRATMELLLDAQTPFEVREADTRAQASGISLAAGAHMLAVQLAPEDLGTVAIEDVLLRVENNLLALDLPFFATVRREMACLLLPTPIDEALGVLLEAHPAVRVGVGRQVNSADAVLHSWADAKLCLAHAPALEHRLMRYDDLDLDMVLINELPLERLRPKIQRWLEPLQRNKLVYETLVQYFRNDFDVARTAQAMSLHHNSVRYRLLRAEEAIGAPLRSAATIVSLHIALRVEAGHELDEPD